MRLMSEILALIALISIVYLSFTDGSIRSMILQLTLLVISLFNLEDSK